MNPDGTHFIPPEVALFFTLLAIAAAWVCAHIYYRKQNSKQMKRDFELSSKLEKHSRRQELAMRAQELTAQNREWEYVRNRDESEGLGVTTDGHATGSSAAVGHGEAVLRSEFREDPEILAIAQKQRFEDAIQTTCTPVGGTLEPPKGSGSLT